MKIYPNRKFIFNVSQSREFKINYQIFLFLGSTQIIGTQEGIVTELWSQTASP